MQDKTTKRQLALPAGKGEIDLQDEVGIKLAARQFELTRGGKATVKLTLDELADGRAAHWVLSVGGRDRDPTGSCA